MNMSILMCTWLHKTGCLIIKLSNWFDNDIHLGLSATMATTPLSTGLPFARPLT